MKDTADAVAQRQIEIYRRLDGVARLQLAFEMSAMARDLGRARLRSEHPDWSLEALNRELLRYSLLVRPMVQRGSGETPFASHKI